MSYVKTDSDGAVTLAYHGLRPRDPEEWHEAESELLADHDGTAYLLAEAEEPADGWDRQDGVIGIVV
jgi:hypothetical protein